MTAIELVRRAVALITEAAEGLESAGIDADQEREWLTDADRVLCEK